MKRGMKFNNLYAEFNESNHMIFGMEEHDDMDCHETCVLWHSMSFYGIPKNIKDEQMDRIYEGDTSNLSKIGEITGCLILCREMNRRGENPFVVCDDLDGDLGYAISVLSESGAPLDVVEGDPDQDVHYIRELDMIPEFKDDFDLKSRILQELPNLVFKFLHVTPDLVIYYPAKLELIREIEVDERYEALKGINNQKMHAAINKIFSFDQLTDQSTDSNVISFGEAYKFSDEELDILYKDDSEPPYPEEEKDADEYMLYEMNGFEEIGESRLLCLQVE
jgi:hypothetical protein